MSEQKKMNLETTTLCKVSEKEKKSWVDVALIQAGVFISVPSLLLGGLLVQSMSMTNAIISGTLGYLLCTLLAVIVGIPGVDLGIPTCVLAQSSFGKKGSRILISSLFAFSMIGWFSVQNSVCGSAFSNFMKEVFNINFSVKISIIIWGLVMLITAVYGINALKLLNVISVPALVIIFVVGCGLALKIYGTAPLFVNSEKETMTIMQGIVLTAGFLSVGLTCAPDFTRYQKNRRGVFASSFIGIIPAGLGLLITGCVLTKLTGEYDLSLVLTNVGIPVLGIITLILATWTTNTTNAYSAGINFVMLFNLKDNKRALATLVSGIIGTAFAVLGIADSLSGFIDWLGILFMPIAGVIIADYWFLRKGKEKNWGYQNGINYVGVIAWVLGVATTILIKSDMSLFVGFAVSIVAYVLIAKVIPQKQENLIGEVHE